MGLGSFHVAFSVMGCKRWLSPADWASRRQGTDWNQAILIHLRVLESQFQIIAHKQSRCCCTWSLMWCCDAGEALDAT